MSTPLPESNDGGAVEINVLFTSAGRRVELLRAFRQAYADLGLQGRIVAVDIDPLAPALRLADCPYIVPRVSDPAFVPTLVEVCRNEQVRLVFPLIDPDIPVLSAHREAIEETGAIVGVVPHESALIAADKWLSYKFLRETGAPTPRTWLPGESCAEGGEYPLFIKPRFGSAGKLTFKVNDRRELDFFLGYVPDPVIQEYLPGPEITSDVICDFNGNVLSVVSRLRLEVRSGEVAKGVTVSNPEVIRQCVSIAAALKAIGPVTVQCILRGEQPCFTEINARFGGGAPLAVHAGVPFPQWYLSLAAGMAVHPPPLGSYRQGLFLTRFDDSFLLTAEDYGRAAGRHI